MTLENLTVPKFITGQLVEFLGGMGTIINCYLNAGKWLYLVQMEMGPEPEMGRIGWETTILLFETDIRSQKHELIPA
jgi:hypothetical protein